MMGTTWFTRMLALTLLVMCSKVSVSQQVGLVSFANSGPAAAQAEFLHGLFQLHNFEYEDAAAHFERAQRIAPDFAMAYWGEAMTENHPVWHEQDRAAALKILARLGKTPEERLAKAATEREKMYLQAVETLYGAGTKEARDLLYEASMASLHRRFPDDVDATSLYALSILGSAEQGRDFAIYMRAAAVLEEVFPQNAHHPGVVHYLIHSYDDPIHAPLGLRAARIYAEVAPEAAHAQHMTSHIFLALGMWDEVVKANETAVAAGSHAPYNGQAGCGHYFYWLAYGYLQQGRPEDARRILAGCQRRAEREARRQQDSVDADDSAVGSYSEMRAMFLIESRLWNDEVVAEHLPAGNHPFAQFTFDYTTAFATVNGGDEVVARAAIAKVESDRVRCDPLLKKTDFDDAEERVRQHILVGQLQALLLLKAGKSDEAVLALEALSAEEHGMPPEFGPPEVNKPTDELLGETLLQLRRPKEARAAFTAALARAPGRRLSTLALADMHE